MFADIDGIDRRISGCHDGIAHRGFGAAITTAPLIHGLKNHVAPDVRVGPQTAWTKLVLGMDAIDMLESCDWAASREPAHIGLHALQRIVSRRVGPLQRLRCCFQFNGLLDHGRGGVYPDEASSLLSNLDLDSSRDYLMFSVVTDGPAYCYTLERRIAQLEALATGFGSAVLDWIGQAGWRTVRLLTPEYVLRMVSYKQWMGEDDESELLAMWRSEGMSEEDIQNSEYLRRADLDAQFPAYALSPNGRVSRVKLKQWATLGTPSVRNVAQALLQVVELIKRKDARLLSVEGIEAESIFVGAALRWNEHDLSARVYDDWVNYWMQGGDGYTEFQSLEAVAVEPEGLRNFFKRLDDGLQLLMALDRLIDLVSEPERPGKMEEHDEGDG
jgi:PRTRC genetic system protein F